MRRIGWNLHRLGLLSANAPWLALAAVIAISALAVYGISRIDAPPHTLNALFQSRSADYQRYEAMRQAFPLSDRDVIVLASKAGPFAPGDIEALWDLHLSLQLLGQSENVLSVFSIRGIPDADGYAPPIIPDELPQGDAFAALMADVAAHPFVAGKLFGTTEAGGQTMVIVAGMKEDAVGPDNLIATIDALTATADEFLDGELGYQLLGVPVMQYEIRFASVHDRLTFNIAGFLVGLFMCLVFFRNLRALAITTLCPALSVLWAYGALGLVGIPLSFFLNAIPPLVMVISFADTTHLVYGIRRRMRAGAAPGDAVRQTVESVGPACLLTTMTTALALLSLLVSNSGAIRDFGIGGAMAVMLIFVVSMLVVPSLAVLILRPPAASKAAPRLAWATDFALDAVCGRLADWVLRHRRPLVAAGIVMSLAFLAVHLNLEPRFRLSEQVPDGMRDRIGAAEQIAGYAAASPVYAVIGYPEGEAPTSPRLSGVVGAVEGALAGRETIGDVWSIALFDRQLENPGGAELGAYLDGLPAFIRGRLLNADARVLLVTGHFPDLDATEMRAVIDALESELDAVRSANPDLSIELTGASVVAALHATTMIGELNLGLMLAIVVVMVLLGVAFRTPLVPLFAFLPNLLPIVASGTLLYLIGFGIDYAGMIALTVAFGLAVDDTIHLIARFWQEEDDGRDRLEAVTTAMRHTGPVMIITTVVLMCGVGVTVFGQMPQTRIFGAVVIVTLFSALAADLFFLPALIGMFWRKGRPDRQQS